MAYTPETVEQFKGMIGAVEAMSGYEQPEAFALGLATVEGEGSEATILDVQYTRRNYAANMGSAAVLAIALDQEREGLQTGQYLLDKTVIGQALEKFKPFLHEWGHNNIDTLRGLYIVAKQDGAYPKSGDSMLSNPLVPVLGVVRNWNDAPQTVGDAYLRLYALSDRHKEPNTINLDGAFGKLVNTITSESMGTFTPEKWNDIQETMVFAGLSRAVRVYDKFPRMLDHVTPLGIRIADPSRVRLGAHLGEGTTVMHEGFSNFNAGTLGSSMVEGRISQGVIVGEGSDVGGGASTQGTLSGGGKEKVSIGERCLLEANSGIGISLGDDCRVEAGIYVKSTTPVRLPDGNVVKASVLSGQDNMMFRRNAHNGAMEMVPNKGGEWGGLNTDLHKN